MLGMICARGRAGQLHASSPSSGPNRAHTAERSPRAHPKRFLDRVQGDPWQGAQGAECSLPAGGPSRSLPL